MPFIPTRTSDLDDALPVFKAAAKAKLKQVGVTRKRVDNINLRGASGLTYNEPQLSTLAVIGLTQGQDLSQAQTITDTNVAIVVAEAGGQVVIHDLAIKALKDPIMRRIAEELVNAYSNYIDNDVTKLFSGLDAGLGSAGTTFASGWLSALHVRLINATRPVQGDLSIVLHPYQYHDIANDIASLGGTTSGAWRRQIGTPAIADQPGSSITGLTEEVWRKYFVSELFGVPVFLDPTITVDSSDDAYGALFGRDAMIFVNYMDPQTEEDRDASMRSTEVNYVGTFGRGEREGTWGFYMLSDAVAPS